MADLLKRRQRRGKRRQPLLRSRKLKIHGVLGKPLVLGRQHRHMSLQASGAVRLELLAPAPCPCRPSRSPNDGAQPQIGV